MMAIIDGGLRKVNLNGGMVPEVDKIAGIRAELMALESRILLSRSQAGKPA